MLNHRIQRVLTDTWSGNTGSVTADTIRHLKHLLGEYGDSVKLPRGYTLVWYMDGERTYVNEIKEKIDSNEIRETSEAPQIKSLDTDAYARSIHPALKEQKPQKFELEKAYDQIRGGNHRAQVWVDLFSLKECPRIQDLPEDIQDEFANQPTQTIINIAKMAGFDGTWMGLTFVRGSTTLA